MSYGNKNVADLQQLFTSSRKLGCMKLVEIISSVYPQYGFPTVSFCISSVQFSTLNESIYFYMLRWLDPIAPYDMNAALSGIGELVSREWLSCCSGLAPGPWPLGVLCWPEFSLGLPQIRWHPEVGGSVVRPSSTRTELASTHDSWTLCAAPAPASVPGHCQTSARADTRIRTGTHTHVPDQGG